MPGLTLIYHEALILTMCGDVSETLDGELGACWVPRQHRRQASSGHTRGNHSLAKHLNQTRDG